MFFFWLCFLFFGCRCLSKTTLLKWFLYFFMILIFLKWFLVAALSVFSLIFLRSDFLCLEGFDKSYEADLSSKKTKEPTDKDTRKDMRRWFWFDLCSGVLSTAPFFFVVGHMGETLANTGLLLFHCAVQESKIQIGFHGL